MKNYSSAFTNIPQTQPIPGKNMVKNNAGGYGFEITPQQRLERFLLIGSEGGTFYVKEQELTIQNASNIIDMIKADGLSVAKTVLDFATENRAPKADPMLFVLALCATYGNAETKAYTYAIIPKVAKTSTQLFTFLANVQNLRGWSRGLRRGVANFYTSRTPDQIAYQMVKYRNRSGFTHKDALRLAHPKATSPEMASLFGYAAGKTAPAESGNLLVTAFEAAQHADVKELPGLIQEYNLTWEMVPTEKLNDTKVLSALLPKMPLTALVRNLNRFSYNDMTKTVNETVKTIVSKLTNEEFVSKSHIHPVNVVNSMLTYSSGCGQKSDKTWNPNQNVVDAMSELYTLSLKFLTPSGKSILLAVDVSGSMNNPVAGMQMTAAQIANVLAVTILKYEKNAEMIWFDTDIHAPKIGRRSSIDEVLRQPTPGGGTDCALAFHHALKNNTKYDAIIILTDSETWSGPSHGTTLLDAYRKKVNKDVKVVEVAMVANPHTTLPDDRNLLRVVGFDASVTTVINEFLK